jgi:hypothetical protein
MAQAARKGQHFGKPQIVKAGRPDPAPAHTRCRPGQVDVVRQEADEVPRRPRYVRCVHNHHAPPAFDQREQPHPAGPTVQNRNTARQPAPGQLGYNTWPDAVIPAQRVAEAQNQRIPLTLHTNSTVRK